GVVPAAGPRRSRARRNSVGSTTLEALATATPSSDPAIRELTNVSAPRDGAAPSPRDDTVLTSGRAAELNRRPANATRASVPNALGPRRRLLRRQWLHSRHGPPSPHDPLSPHRPRSPHGPHSPHRPRDGHRTPAAKAPLANPPGAGSAGWPT